MSTRVTKPSNMYGVQQQILGLSPKGDNLEAGLLNLVRMRASQINGCATCLAMHAREMREQGEREDRLYVLSAWRDTGWFTEREQAALAWTEAVTMLANGEVPDEVYSQARAQFSELELAELTLDVIAINSWNRLNIAFRVQPEPLTIESQTAVAAG